MRFEDKQWSICNALHRNLKNEQHEIHNKPGEIRGSGIVSYSNSMGETVFLDKYWKFPTINTDQDPLKIWNFFVKKAYLNPDRNHKL